MSTNILDTAAATFAATIAAEWPYQIAARAGGNLRPQYVHEEGRTSETNVYGSEKAHVTPDGVTLRLSHGGAFVVGVRGDFMEWIARADEDELDNLMHNNPAHESSDFDYSISLGADERVESMKPYETMQAVLDLEIWENDSDGSNGTMAAAAEWIARDFYRAVWKSYETSLREALVEATEDAEGDA
jgi:hypothetical protein